jgi:signal transduction histidine kinase
MLIILFPSISISGTPIISYIVGSILTLILINIAIKWSLSPPLWSFSERSHIVAGFGFVAVATSLYLGEFVNIQFLQQNPAFLVSPLANVVLLGFNLTVMLTFTYLVFLLAKSSSGKLTTELYTFSFLSVWILHSILKSYYAVWTPGWWVSEYILFIGLILGPTVLALLYVGAIGEVEESHQRANLYADLLMHDVTNYNQMAMTALELLQAECESDDTLLEYADHAIKAVLLSNRLIGNVRSLSESELIHPSDLKSVELVSSIVGALDLVSQSVGKERVRTQFITDHSHVHVIANELLVTAFFNILYSSVQHTKAGESVLLELSPYTDNFEQWWQLRLIVPSSYGGSLEGSFLEREPGRYSGKTLGVFVSRLLFESFGGSITINEEHPDSESMLTVITVQLRGSYPIAGT